MIVVQAETSKLIEKLQDSGAFYIMARNHTDCTEIDFQTREEVDMVNLSLENLSFFVFTQLIPDENNKPAANENNMRIAIFMANWLIGEERYWETHELLEDIWHISGGNIREYFHGLTLLAVAGVQWQTGREDIARATYIRAVAKLRSSGINMEFVESLPQVYVYPLKIRIPEDVPRME